VGHRMVVRARDGSADDADDIGERRSTEGDAQRDAEHGACASRVVPGERSDLLGKGLVDGYRCSSVDPSAAYWHAMRDSKERDESSH